MTRNKYMYMALAFCGLFVGCSSDDDMVDDTPQSVEYSSGSADFSTYVAVGNSLTAGYGDAALSIQGQEDSYPNIMAQQFALAGGGEFNQPLMNDNLGGMTYMGIPILDNRLILSFATGSPAPVAVEGVPATDVTNVLSGSFNNMGVPGAKIFHLGVEGYGNLSGLLNGSANPYFARFASSPSATVIGDAMAQNPSFFSLWIGNNDVLAYAMAGGDGADQTGNLNPATYGFNDVTDPNVFASVYSTLLQTLTSGGAKGIVANIPDINSLPYFTTVPYNPIPLDAATAAQLNAAFAQYNGGLAQLASLGAITEAEKDKRTIYFEEGMANRLLIVDEDLTDLSAYSLPNYRQTTSDDLIVFTAQTIIGTSVGGDPTMVNGVSVPLADEWVLTPEEQQVVTTARTAYNTTITALASQYGLGFVDVAAALDLVSEGNVTLSGTSFTSDYATGGAFSLDGVHPSARGYAYIANLFITEINETYGSDLPMVDPLDYTALYLE